MKLKKYGVGKLVTEFYFSLHENDELCYSFSLLKNPENLRWAKAKNSLLSG